MTNTTQNVVAISPEAAANNKDLVCHQAEAVRQVIMTAVAQSKIIVGQAPLSVLMGVATAYAQIGVVVESMMEVETKPGELRTLMKAVACQMIDSVLDTELADQEVPA